MAKKKDEPVEELVIEDDAPAEEEAPVEEAAAEEEEAPVEGSGPEVVAVDDEGNQYIKAPAGGLFGDDGETNFSRTLSPSESEALSPEGLTGVDPDYPAPASRGPASSDD